MTTSATTPTISPVLRYADGPAAIDWLIRALGFEKHTDHRTADNAVAHADLRFGSSSIGVSSRSTSAPDSPWAQVRQGLYVRVDNPDAVHDRAVAAGAGIVSPLKDLDYGSRDFSLRDPSGHLWAFGTYDTGATGGEPSIWPEMRYPDAAAAVVWLERALGFRCALSVPSPDATDGAPLHVEMRLGSSVLMFGSGWPSGSGWAELGHVVHLRVDDPDAHCAVARAAGASMVHEPQTAPYGARFYSVRDPEGFVWWISNYTPK